MFSKLLKNLVVEKLFLPGDLAIGVTFQIWLQIFSISWTYFLNSAGPDWACKCLLAKARKGDVVMIQSWTELMIPQEIDDLLKFIPIWPNCVKTQWGETISGAGFLYFHVPNVFTRYFLKVLIYFDKCKIEEMSSENVGTNATSEIILKERIFRSFLKPLWKKSSIKGSYSSTDSLDSYVIQALVLQISYTPLKKVSWVFM